MNLQDLEKLITFYTNSTILSEQTKYILIKALYQKYGNV